MSAIILAGGKSRRMGSSKADLMLGGKSLLEWVAEALQESFEELLVVAPSPPQTLPKAARLITDELPDFGPLGGVYAGLNASREPWSFVSGCDTPFLRPELVKGLMDLTEGYAAVVPVEADRIHPLCGAYSHACLPALAQALHAGESRLSVCLRQQNTRFIETTELQRFDPALISFFNLNTPDDLQVAEIYLKSFWLDDSSK